MLPLQYIGEYTLMLKYVPRHDGIDVNMQIQDEWFHTPNHTHGYVHGSLIKILFIVGCLSSPLFDLIMIQLGPT